MFSSKLISAVGCVALFSSSLFAQNSVKLKYSNSSLYAGIEVGSKGVKMSIVEIGKNARKDGTFNILKDTSVNTDFISFSKSASDNTLNSLVGLYTAALTRYGVTAGNVFTVISSGVKVQAEKDAKTDFINELISSFREKIKDKQRKVEIVDISEEARLSHLGIIPEEQRYKTFLIDIGSGNTKGGYFPYGNTKDFKLFQLTWGTKSIANAVEKRLDESDKTLVAFNKQLSRVLTGVENSEINYAVNTSGAYLLSDNIAFSGGIVWSVATLLHPEMADKAVVPVSFKEVYEFNERLFRNFETTSADALLKQIKGSPGLKEIAGKEISRVHGVFDQRSLMAGTGLLLKLMRQFASIYETKQFFFVKNGQVGWISAYVDQNIPK